MLVAQRMTKDPVIVAPDETIGKAAQILRRSNFRHLPVVERGKLVGILSERDLRGQPDQGTQVSRVMKTAVKRVTPETTLEQAARVLLEEKIGALPVVAGDRVLGIITTTDILRAFLDVTGVLTADSVRIDVAFEEGGPTLPSALQLIESEGAEILVLGTYREKWGETPVCYIRLRGPAPKLSWSRSKRKASMSWGLTRNVALFRREAAPPQVALLPEAVCLSLGTESAPEASRIP